MIGKILTLIVPAWAVMGLIMYCINYWAKRWGPEHD
jgi:hypothetical protein